MGTERAKALCWTRKSSLTQVNSNKITSPQWIRVRWWEEKIYLKNFYWVPCFSKPSKRQHFLGPRSTGRKADAPAQVWSLATFFRSDEDQQRVVPGRGQCLWTSPTHRTLQLCTSVWVLEENKYHFNTTWRSLGWLIWHFIEFGFTSGSNLDSFYPIFGINIYLFFCFVLSSSSIFFS